MGCDEEKVARLDELLLATTLIPLVLPTADDDSCTAARRRRPPQVMSPDGCSTNKAQLQRSFAFEGSDFARRGVCG